MTLIEVYDLQLDDWLRPQPATAADEPKGIPEPRVKPCSVIARAKDGSSYNIYMFGGWTPKVDGNDTRGYNDIWVLSIPSFKWFLVNTGSPASFVPPKYEGMTCYIVGGGSKMLVYGGRTRPNFEGACDKIAIHVFDMTTLMWEEAYDPIGGEYQVPKQIYDVIGGGPYGGATLFPEKGMANLGMGDQFKGIIVKTTNTNSTSRGASGGTTQDSKSSKSGASSWIIGGVVLGALIGIPLIILGTMGLLKRMKARARGEARARGGDLPASNGKPLEMPSTLPPGELPPYVPRMQVHQP